MEKLFKWFTFDNNESTVRLSWFTANFEPEEFEGIDKLFALFLKFCADMSVTAKRQYLETFLQTEGLKCIKINNVRLETMDHFDYNEPASLAEAYRVISDTALKTYDFYMQQDLEDKEFKVEMYSFIQEQKRKRVQSTMMEIIPVMSGGGDMEEAVDNLQFKLDTIQKVYNVSRLDRLDFLLGADGNVKDPAKMRFLFKTGLPCVDGDTDGMYTKQVWSFTGQPGSGKTRLAAIHGAYHAAVFEKKGTYFRELELSTDEVKNMLIAYHIIQLYKGKIKIPDKLMNQGKLSDEQSKYYESAKIDLFESGKYGRILINDEPLIVEDFYKEYMNFVKHNRDIEFCIIDYAGLVKSKPKGKYDKPLIEFEAIGELYKTSKEVAKDADIGFWILNQFNEKGITAAYAGHKIVAGHIQGGQIIQRHSDYDVAMTMTEEQELAKMRCMSTVKKRAATGFQNVPFSTDLAVSIFRQLNTKSLT